MKSAHHIFNRIDWKSPSSGPDAVAHAYLSGDMAVCGPDGDPEEVIIIEGQAVSFAEMLEDFTSRMGIPPGEQGALPQHVGSPVRRWVSETLVPLDPVLVSGDGAHRIVAIDNPDPGMEGLVALSETASNDFCIRGLFTSSGVSVAPAWQGLGIGAGMVAARLLHSGDLPTWQSSTPTCNQIGSETLVSGLRLADRIVLARTSEGPGF